VIEINSMKNIFLVTMLMIMKMTTPAMLMIAIMMTVRMKMMLRRM